LYILKEQLENMKCIYLYEVEHKYQLVVRIKSKYFKIVLAPITLEDLESDRTVGRSTP
jgi:hypothetical protein